MHGVGEQIYQIIKFGLRLNNRSAVTMPTIIINEYRMVDGAKTEIFGSYSIANLFACSNMSVYICASVFLQLLRWKNIDIEIFSQFQWIYGSFVRAW